MPVFRISCGNCGALRTPRVSGADGELACPACQAVSEFVVFPALVREVEAQPGEALLDAAESSCFYHPHKRAVVPCDQCGRFLCSLCDVPLGSQHLCPKCIERDEASGDAGRLKREMTHYDEIALALAVFPMLFFYVTFITAPIAFFLAVRHWNTRMSIVPRGRSTLVLAIALSGIQLAGWALAGVALVTLWIGVLE